MKIAKLTNNEKSPFTHIAVFDYVDIQNNATSSNQVEIARIPAGGGIELAGVYEETALAGASDITLDVGTTTADPDEFIDALDVDAMSAPVYNTGDSFVQVAGNTTTKGGSLPVGSTNTETAVVVEWNGTVASLTAGKVIIGLRIVDLGAYADA